MYTALTSAQTNGDPFRVPKSGPWDVQVSGYADVVTVQSQAGSDWVNLDVSGEDAATWKSDGHGAIWLAASRVYRISTETAGATVTLAPLNDRRTSLQSDHAVSA